MKLRPVVLLGVATLSVPFFSAIPLQASTLAATHSSRSFLRVRRESLAGPIGYTPQQIRKAYGFDKVSAKGAGKSIAIVGAYDNPAIEQDLAVFSQQFSLTPLNGLPGQPSCSLAAGPHPCFQKIYAETKPARNAGWSMESSLDTEWSHAIADKADIILVEAKNSQTDSLMKAVDVATSLNPTVVSMSWGGAEYSAETDLDRHFNHPGIMYVAASGDNGAGTSFPAASSHVLAVGGTALPLADDGTRKGPETAWSGSGGGISTYFAQPSYQAPFAATKGKRAIPDVSYNADPETGYAVLSKAGVSQGNGWAQVGGTSAAAPQWAALLTLSGKKAISVQSLYALGQGDNYLKSYIDIVSGKNGSCLAMCAAHGQYDLVTGLGSPAVPHLLSAL